MIRADRSTQTLCANPMFKLFKKKTVESLGDSSCIVPRIKHTNMLAALSEKKIPADQLPITEPLVADLVVSYAFELPEAFQLVTQADLQRLGMTKNDLRPIALKNLRRQLTNIKTEGQGSPVYMLTAGGDLGACLLLIDEVWDDLAGQIPGELVIVVPSRGIVLVTSSEWPEGLALMREITIDSRGIETTHRLSEIFLLRRQGTWVIFDEAHN